MRPVGVAHVEVGDHIVDDVVNIDILGIVRIGGAIGVAALDSLVGSLIPQSPTGEVEHRIPGLGAPIGGGAVGVGIPVFLLATEVSGRKGVVRTLNRIVEPPVGPVDVDMQKALVRGDIAHGQDGLATEGVTDIERIIAGTAPLPAIIGVRTQHDGVKTVVGIVAKERIAELRVAVDFPEQEPQ